MRSRRFSLPLLDQPGGSFQIVRLNQEVGSFLRRAKALGQYGGLLVGPFCLRLGG